MFIVVEKIIPGLSISKDLLRRTAERTLINLGKSPARSHHILSSQRKLLNLTPDLLSPAVPVFSLGIIISNLLKRNSMLDIQKYGSSEKCMIQITDSIAHHRIFRPELTENPLPFRKQVSLIT